MHSPPADEDCQGRRSGLTFEAGIASGADRSAGGTGKPPFARGHRVRRTRRLQHPQSIRPSLRTRFDGAARRLRPPCTATHTRPQNDTQAATGPVDQWIPEPQGGKFCSAGVRSTGANQEALTVPVAAAAPSYLSYPSYPSYQPPERSFFRLPAPGRRADRRAGAQRAGRPAGIADGFRGDDLSTIRSTFSI